MNRDVKSEPVSSSASLLRFPDPSKKPPPTPRMLRLVLHFVEML